MDFTFGTVHVRITHPDREALSSEVTARLAAGRGFRLATLNLDHIVKLRRDPAFARAYAAHDIVVADGNPVVWVARLAGQPVGLVPGSDMVLPLARVAAGLGLPVSLVGTTAPALAASRAEMARTIPGLRTGLDFAPPMGFDPEGEGARALALRLAALGPGLCFVALSAPRQERFAAFAGRIAPQTGFASVGAGLDFIAGLQVRAPGWMRGLALEWLWRMGTAPRRMVPRYAACAAVLPGLALQALRQRRPPGRPAA
jgi:exopolysaccharide biosynthesis WecB/TagA/CpsF family protein